MTATLHYIYVYILFLISVVVETALSYFRNFQQWEEDHPLATSLILGATSYRDICVASWLCSTKDATKNGQGRTSITQYMHMRLR